MLWVGRAPRLANGRQPRASPSARMMQAGGDARRHRPRDYGNRFTGALSHARFTVVSVPALCYLDTLTCRISSECAGAAPRATPHA